MSNFFKDIEKLSKDAANKIKEVSKGLFAENLATELKDLQNAEMLSVLPVLYTPCISCSQGPQYFYKIQIGEKLIAHIMHGRQGAVDPSCSKCFTACINKACGTGMFKQCTVFCKQCSKACKCVGECIRCKPLGACCRRCGTYVQYVQQFEDYENAIEVKHSQTPLGWGYSEKDGLYIGRKEFAVGAFYQTSPQNPTDWVAEYQARAVTAMNAINAEGGAEGGEVKIKGEISLDKLDLPKLNDDDEEVWEDVAQFFACQFGMAKSEYVRITEQQRPLMETYAIHYLGKYVGRYIYGYLEKSILWHCCWPTLGPGYFGYIYRDDVYLLDNFDNLIFRFTMKELSYYEAVNDAGTGNLYCLSIYDVTQNLVGQVLKRKASRCCGICSNWSFDLNFPRSSTPIQKLLIAYLIPFLNEKYMNLWSPDVSHEIEDLKHDVQWAEMQKGAQSILFDRLVDQMSYKGVEGLEVPKLLGTIALTNPSRKEGQAIRFQSYKQSYALQREYVRRKKAEAKALVLQEMLEKEISALQNDRESVK